MTVKKVIISLLPCVLMYVMSVLYASCQLLIMHVFDLPTYDEFVFDANDLTRVFFSVFPALPIVFSVFVSKRLSDVGYLRVIYICISSVLIFYISSLFINGLMLK